jgi:hypothetical protein
MEQPEEPVESQDIDSSVTRSPLQWTLDVTDSIEVDASQDEAVTESAPKKRCVKQESTKKRMRRQWSSICKRSDTWQKITSPLTPSFVCLFLEKDQIQWTGMELNINELYLFPFKYVLL